MTWTQYDCPCGEVIGANGWIDGRTLAEVKWFEHLESVHPEWLTPRLIFEAPTKEKN